MRSTKAKTLRATAGATLHQFNAAELVDSVQGFATQLKAGKIGNLRVSDVTLPPRLPARSGPEVRAVREKLGVSQAVFAAALNVPPRTVISWENSQRKPSGAALKLLDIALRHPEVILGN